MRHVPMRPRNFTTFLSGWTLLLILAATLPLAPKLVAAQDPLAEADFVHVAAGTFQMGDSILESGRPLGGPVHRVTLTHGFWLQKTPVTQAQWQAVMGSNPSNHKECPTCPVENVTYDDVQAFITKLNSHSPAKKYRLPTEAEWEYAARAGSTGEFGVPGEVTAGGWIRDNSGGTTHPVGGLRPNAWGLYDMEGNVWEWVSDAWGPYQPSPITDPTGPASSKSHVLRGGSYFTPALNARSAPAVLAWRVKGMPRRGSAWQGRSSRMLTRRCLSTTTPVARRPTRAGRIKDEEVRRQSKLVLQCRIQPEVAGIRAVDSAGQRWASGRTCRCN